MKCVHKAVSLALSVFLAGCNLAPVYERPTAPAPLNWPSGGAYPDDVAGNGVLAHWDSFYLDPDLRRLIRIGIDNNRDLRQAGLRVEAYRALNRIQHAATQPDVAAYASEQRQRLPADLSPTGQAAVQSRFSVGTMVSYELDFFGKLRNLDQASLEIYLASEQAHQSARLTLVASIADGYFAWRTDQSRYALVLATLENFKHSLRLVESNEQAGLATALAVRQARSLVLQGQTQAVVYQRRLADDVNALSLLLGVPVPADIGPERSLEGAIAVGVPIGLPSDLLLRRPDILAAEHSLLAANANVGAARAAFFPRISLTAGAGSTSAALDGLFSGGSGTWSFLPQISVPIFNTGRLKASQAYAEINKDINVAQYEGAIQRAFKEVADGLAARGTFVTQLKGQQDQVQNAREYVAIAQQRYDRGLDGYLAVLDAQRSLLDLQQQLLTSQFEQLAAEVDLFRALGGGWDASHAMLAASRKEPY